MDKHTPGPWYVDRKYVVGPKDDSESQSHGMVIGLADVYGDNREQDSRLIAAAPDLLQMLKVAQLWLDVDGRYDMQGINAAIAKAEGLS